MREAFSTELPHIAVKCEYDPDRYYFEIYLELPERRGYRLMIADRYISPPMEEDEMYKRALVEGGETFITSVMDSDPQERVIPEHIRRAYDESWIAFRESLKPHIHEIIARLKWNEYQGEIKQIAKRLSLDALAVLRAIQRDYIVSPDGWRWDLFKRGYYGKEGELYWRLIKTGLIIGDTDLSGQTSFSMTSRGHDTLAALREQEADR